MLQEQQYYNNLHLVRSLDKALNNNNKNYVHVLKWPREERAVFAVGFCIVE